MNFNTYRLIALPAKEVQSFAAFNFIVATSENYLVDLRLTLYYA
jgi:hypothetical protein